MNNLLSYCGLVDTRISASDKDLPVILPSKTKNYSHVCLFKWYLKLPNYLAINHKYKRRGLTLLVLFTGGFERYTQVKQRLRDGWRKAKESNKGSEISLDF